MRKWPGVRASIPSSSLFRGTRGLLFRHASIWVRMVESSLNVSLTFPTMRFKCYLTAASHRPPKLGDCGGMNFQLTLWVERKLEMEVWVWLLRRNLYRSLISLAAQTKLDPWSLQMSKGMPRRDMKRRRQAIKVSVVRSLTNSRWTALTARDTNIRLHDRWLTSMSILNEKGTSIINSNFVKHRAWS